MNDEQKWASSLKAGDEVAVMNGRGWNIHTRIDRVQRVTATLIIVGATKFNKRRLREIGRCYSGSSIGPVTQEVRDEIMDRSRRNAALNILTGIVWHRETTDVLRVMAETYRQCREESQSPDAVDPSAPPRESGPRA